ncbi:FG-GAP repeat domain-containing protein [Burkholderia multivorans]|uniref:FG-GAP repeat domain-containing protein n=1 Tax=Burkholderia multivorans TaxID=87883 RepID=UPI001562150C|nr:VCBS repeat-containing protein [Burkholderia multivorans]MBU9120521.1 VCBS repeat-containing protein [Burkholderia multivorans]
MKLNASTTLVIGVSAALISACGGGGDGSSSPTPASPPNPASTPSVKATPILVQKTSYLNKIAAATALGPQNVPSEVTSSNSVAFADFFQDGTYSMVTHTLVYNPADPSTYSNFGTVHFYKNVSGQWVDHTPDLLSNTTGCLHPRKAIVADFNGDGKPDVFFACTGPDASPFPGEQPHMLLSQSDGRYKNVTLPYSGYFHGASAADFNGNGYADIVVTDTNVHKTPYFLANNHDGTFNQDFSRVPALVGYTADGSAPNPCTGCFPEIFTTELIDFNNTGKLDLFFGGNAPDNRQGNWKPVILKNNGDNTYSQSNETVLPYSMNYQTALDVLSVNGAIYTTNVNLSYNASVYGYSDIEKITNGVNTQIWSNNANFPNGVSWLNWIIPYQNKIDSLATVYGVSVPQ